MTPDRQEQLNQHIQAIAEILYQEVDREQIANFEGIEQTIREQTLEYITPQLGFFYPKNYPNNDWKNQENQKSTWGVVNHRKTSNPSENC
jgi:hypothetical protein